MAKITAIRIGTDSDEVLIALDDGTRVHFLVADCPFDPRIVTGGEVTFDGHGGATLDLVIGRPTRFHSRNFRHDHAR